MTTLNDQPDWLKAHHTAHPSGGPRGWIRGESGNPNGRPKGSRNKKTALVEEFEKDGSAIARKVIEAALAGDLQACNIALSRISGYSGRP